MDALAKLLREIWPRLWEAIVALFSYRKGRADEARDAQSLRDRAENAALERVLGAPRADGMSREAAVSELKRRGLWRVSEKPADAE